MILTVGIYGFWGRTEIRRRMWSSVRLRGEPLAYHGTPQELLKGFLAVMLVVLVPLFLAGIAVVVFFGQASAVFGIYQFGLFLGHLSGPGGRRLLSRPALSTVAHVVARRTGQHQRLVDELWPRELGDRLGVSVHARLDRALSRHLAAAQDRHRHATR